VGHVGGKAVFLPGTAPGDRVRFRAGKDHGRWLKGEVTELVSPGPDRVEALCPVAGECGGCQWQHVSAEAQRRARREIVTDALTRIGGLDQLPEIQEAPPGEALGYRRRAEYQGEVVAGGNVRLGFFAAGSHRIVEHERCLLLEAPLADGIAALRTQLGTRLHRPARFQVEATLLTGPTLQILVRVEPAGAKEMLAALEDWSAPGLAATQVAVRALGELRAYRDPKGAPFVLEELSLPHPGEEELRYTLYTRPGEFVQANAAANRELLAALLAEAGPLADRWVLDLYCGAGNLTLPLALSGAKVLGVETRRTALRSARKAARVARVARARFKAEAAGEILPRLAAEERRYHTVVLDPPRQGAPELAEFLEPLGVEQILAVSCHPATLARDVAAWKERGFELRSLRLFDFFPQTHHVELLAALSRTA